MCTIAETGFGSGLNFLVTWQAWQRSRAEQHCPNLYFISIEKHPLRLADLVAALSPWQELSQLTEALVQNYPPPTPGRHRLLFEEGAVILDLIYADVIPALQELERSPSLTIDHWYLDGFSPSKNPAMWNEQLYQSMAQLGRNGTSFTTFTAAGRVRRGLRAVGFEVEKRPGFGQKREMLRGTLIQRQKLTPAKAPQWHLSSNKSAPSEQYAVVIGAGLAGASIANALARRHWNVEVLDQAQIASAGSGNQQGILFTRLSHRTSALNSFSIESYCFALRHYRDLFNRKLLTPGIDGEFCGALHLLDDFQADNDFAATLSSLPELATYLDTQKATAVSGIEHCPPGLFFDQAGWLNPPSVCRALLSSDNIDVRENMGPLKISQQGNLWSILDSSERIIASAETLIIAGGTDSALHSPLSWLPLQAVRGQVTHLPSRGNLQKLQTVICHEGYVAPPVQEYHCIGATFDVGDLETQEKTSSHLENIQRLESALGIDLQTSTDLEQVEGRVGFRCASPDYLPIVGPVPEYSAFVEHLGGLRNSAKQHRSEPGCYLKGLFVTTAHGSRGLTSTPLTAELLAAQICAEPFPFDTPLLQAVSPARFIIRDLIRNRV